MNFTYRKIVGHGRCHAKPRTQLRAATRARPAARKLVFALAVEVSSRKRICVRYFVIDLHEPAVWRLLAPIVHDKWARETERGIQTRDIESQLVWCNALLTEPNSWRFESARGVGALPFRVVPNRNRLPS